MLKTKIKIPVVLLLIFFSLNSSFKAQSDEIVRVKFNKGKNSKTINSAVLRDEVITYVIGAKKGQKMSVKITAVEDNASFSIKTPSDGFLENAGEMDDQTVWNGTLPESGDYKIEVGSNRGNANFRLTITIK